jgi:hypothetical protein
VDELSGKWMIIAVSSKADEKNSMLEWPDGVAQRSDQGGLRYLLGEQGRQTRVVIDDGQGRKPVI